MTTPALRITGLAKTYHAALGPVPVLADVAFDLAPGQKASLVGPSGSGKSTLLGLIAGLLNPDAGRVEIGGIDLATLDDHGRAALRARGIGVALQSGNLIPFLTSVENVELALSYGDAPHSTAAAMSALERMGVAHRAHHRPSRLSGGEAQRVALAVALANAPRILLADEIVSQLDTVTAETVVDDIFGRDMAMLFVTHDPRLAARAELRLRIDGNRIVQQ